MFVFEFTEYKLGCGVIMSDFSQDQLVHKRESVYFILVVLFSVLMYVTLAFTVIGIIVILVLILISVLLHGIMIGGIRRNGVKISERQFPELYEKAAITAKNMGFTVIPDIYVVESEGVLNAFATRFFGKNMVVLYSGIFELIEKEAEKEVLFVLAHEFAHLKRKHVIISTFILPAMWVPFLGNAYLRACEYTCDRYAAYYVQSFEASKNALTTLAIGKELYTKVNKEAYMEQLQTESGFFVWLNEKLSTHPHLPKRIYAISKYFSAETTVELKEPKGKVWLGIVGIIAAVLLVSAGTAMAGFKLSNNDAVMETLEGYGESADVYNGSVNEDTDSVDDEYYDSITKLMSAASQNDIGTINGLLSNGAKLEETDIEGYTALHWAIAYDQYEAAQTLLEAGANPNAVDAYGTHPLMTAVFNNNLEIVKLLLDYGADRDFKDSQDQTAYDYALEYGDNEVIRLLE